MHFYSMFAQFRSKVVANITNIFENKDDRVDCIVGRSVIMISIGKMLEKCKEVGDTFGFQSDL